jgi:hypothetical protein
MVSPISNFLENTKKVETRPLKLGGHVYQITLSLRLWYFLDRMLWEGFDVQDFLDDCSKNIIDNDPSYTLDLWLDSIGTDQEQENGINLKVRD